MKKHLVKFKIDGVSKQRTVVTDSIYNAERAIRKEFGLTDGSGRLYVKTIKCGRTEYQVFGSVLG